MWESSFWGHELLWPLCSSFSSLFPHIGEKNVNKHWAALKVLLVPAMLVFVGWPRVIPFFWGVQVRSVPSGMFCAWSCAWRLCQCSLCFPVSAQLGWSMEPLSLPEPGIPAGKSSSVAQEKFHVLVGVTGSVAALKLPLLVAELLKIPGVSEAVGGAL